MCLISVSSSSLSDASFGCPALLIGSAPRKGVIGVGVDDSNCSSKVTSYDIGKLDAGSLGVHLRMQEGYSFLVS